MNGRTIRLFPQAEGDRLGLMPVPINEPPGKYQVDFLGADGSVRHTAEVTVRDARFPVQNLIIGKATRELKPSPGEMETVAAFRKTVTETRRWTEPFVAPVSGCMNSPFGVKRLYNGQPTGQYHGGVDQRSPAGRPIRAVTSGVVGMVRTYNLHGNVVGIDHGQGLLTIYLHMSKIAVAEGAVVHPGDVIGYVGATGRATGPHLHWQVYANGVAVNPLQWVGLKPCAAGGGSRPGHKKRTARQAGGQ